MLNWISWAISVSSLNSKGLLQITESEFQRREKVSEDLLPWNRLCYRGGAAPAPSAEKPKHRWLSPHVYTTDTPTAALPWKPVFKIQQYKKLWRGFPSQSNESEVQNKHGIIDSLTKTLPEISKRHTPGLTLLPLPSVKPSIIDFSSLHSTSKSAIITF